MDSSGTHQGDFDGIAPTGKPIAVTGITILRRNNHTLREQLE